MKNPSSWQVSSAELMIQSRPGDFRGFNSAFLSQRAISRKSYVTKPTVILFLHMGHLIFCAGIISNSLLSVMNEYEALGGRRDLWHTLPFP